MGRLEKTIKRKSKRNKYRSIVRSVFTIILITNVMMAILVVEINIKTMLGEKMQIKNIINDTRTYIEFHIKSLTGLSESIVRQFK